MSGFYDNYDSTEYFFSDEWEHCMSFCHCGLLKLHFHWLANTSEIRDCKTNNYQKPFQISKLGANFFYNLFHEMCNLTDFRYDRNYGEVRSEWLNSSRRGMVVVLRYSQLVGAGHAPYNICNPVSGQQRTEKISNQWCVYNQLYVTSSVQPSNSSSC